MSDRPQIVAVAYTGDLDPSVAGLEPLPGFGPFVLPLTGRLSALIGKNGSGKSRFLHSIGRQSELLHQMPRSPSDDRLDPSRLWGLAPTKVAEHRWVSPDLSGVFDDVRSTWPEAPGDRFKWFDEQLRHGTLAERANTSPESDALTTDEWSASQRAVELLPAEFHRLTAYVAASMTHSEFALGKLGTDLFSAALASEIAQQLIVSTTYGLHHGRQRLRFWFGADAATTPMSAALLAAHAVYGSPNPGSRNDLVPELAPDVELYDVIGGAPLEGEMICYSANPGGLVLLPGSNLHFTPQLALELHGNVGVFCETDHELLWMEGIRAVGPHGGSGQPDWWPVQDGHQISSWGFRRHPSDPAGSAMANLLRGDLSADELDHYLELAEEEERRAAAAAAERAERLSLELLTGDAHPGALSFEFSSDTREFGIRAVRAANAVAQVLMDDPPTALLDASSGTLAWRFVKNGPAPSSAGGLLTFDQLSFAERRWMKFSIRLAGRLFDRVLKLYGNHDDQTWCAESLGPCFIDSSASAFYDGDLVVTIDEPEAGLHPTAVDRLARGLNELAEQLGLHIICATHSPHILRVTHAANGTTAHASIDLDGNTIFKVIDTDELSEFASDLGMSPADLLQTTTSFLIVKADHADVLDELIGADLRNAGVVVLTLPQDGSGLFVGSELLWRFTDARVVVLLDAGDPPEVEELIELSKQANGDQNAMALMDELRPSSTDGGCIGPGALDELVRSALTNGGLQRMETFRLGMTAIARYFHPAALAHLDASSPLRTMSGAEAWNHLDEQYQQAVRAGQESLRFSDWLFGLLGVEASPEVALRAAAADLGRLPEDFFRLRSLLLVAASGSGARTSHAAPEREGTE